MRQQHRTPTEPDLVLGDDTRRPIRLAERTIDQQDIDELIDWLSDYPWLTQGKLVAQFERRWADWLGARHAVFVNSGSSANLLMYYALLCSGRLKNNKVIVPSVAWATTIAPAIQLGFEPILCEADPDNFGLDLDHLEELLNRHQAASVIGVHVLGVPMDMQRLIDLKERFGFALMEDSCAATGSRYRGQHVGTFGELSSFSFYFGHHLSTIEGGMVCTDDDELNEILLQIRSHGWAKDLDPVREQQKARKAGVLEFNRRFTFYYPGFNVRSTDLNARIGLSQMSKADRVVAARRDNHRIYQARFDRAGWPCQHNLDAEISSISFAALAQSSAHRDAIGEALRRHGIETRPLGGGSMARQPFWTNDRNVVPLQMADRIHDTAFHLPNNPELTEDDINYVCDVVLSVKPDYPC